LELRYNALGSNVAHQLKERISKAMSGKLLAATGIGPLFSALPVDLARLPHQNGNAG
jgi:hypothetical protein